MGCYFPLEMKVKNIYFRKMQFMSRRMASGTNPYELNKK